MKDILAGETKEAVEKGFEYYERLEKFGLLEGQVSSKKTMVEDVDFENSPGNLAVSEKDLDALKDVNITMVIKKYGERAVKPKKEVETFFREIKTMEVETEYLKGCYELSLLAMREAEMQKVDMNVVLAVEIVPRIGEKKYHRVLHAGQYGIWMEGMKQLKGGEYEIVAYLYGAKDAEAAVERLEKESEILKY